MAVTRTILPRKGLIQSQHGLTNYESDQDTNWQLLDANVAFLADLGGAQNADLGLNGVVAGFALSPSSSLIPGFTNGILYAQGSRYAPAVRPVLPAAPGSAATYLFFSSASGFYYQSGASGASAGDVLIGKVAASAAAVISVTTATKVYGQVPVSANSAGSFTVAHLLGRVPVGVSIQMTSAGSIWFQSGVMYDGANVYLAASGTGVTAMLQVW